jgi:hypothetical protein
MTKVVWVRETFDAYLSLGGVPTGYAADNLKSPACDIFWL